MTQRIASARNRRIVWLRKLQQRKYRQAERCFPVEGLQLIHMGLVGGQVPRTVFYSEELFKGRGAPSLLERCRGAGAELVAVAEGVLAGLSSRDACQGLVAVFPFVDVGLEALGEFGAALVLILDRLQNPGNVGTLVRTADAVGAAGVVLLEPAADLYDPAAVRSSMGSLFNLPVVRCRAAHEAFAALRRGAWSVMGADPHRGTLWSRVGWQERVALVLGNEARGLSADVLPHLGTWVRLPMAGAAESLNVAVTGGVLMYAWLDRAPAAGPGVDRPVPRSESDRPAPACVAAQTHPAR